MDISNPIKELVAGISDGKIIPYLGPGVLEGVVSKDSNEPIPADSDSLILAMNGGNPMAPRLMYEFPRAAMNLELKKGRKFIERFLTTTYGDTQWTESPFHHWLAELDAPYVIDTNRDTQLQNFYRQKPHTLVVGLARMAGTDYRFKLFHFDGSGYQQIELADVDTAMPVLFKPMGTPVPEPLYIASDADYVDYITELMGGFGMPAFLKMFRRNKQYLFVGMRLTRDTERMILSDVIYDAAEPAGWALLPNATDKEKAFCAKKNIQILDIDWQTLIKATNNLKMSA